MMIRAEDLKVLDYAIVAVAIDMVYLNDEHIATNPTYVSIPFKRRSSIAIIFTRPIYSRRTGFVSCSTRLKRILAPLAAEVKLP